MASTSEPTDSQDRFHKNSSNWVTLEYQTACIWWQNQTGEDICNAVAWHALPFSSSHQVINAVYHAVCSMKHKAKVSVLLMVLLHNCTIEEEVLAARLSGFKNHNFCFADQIAHEMLMRLLMIMRLTVSWCCSQKVASASSCHWSPAGPVDIKMRSLAYSNVGAKDAAKLWCITANSFQQP